MAEPKAAWMLNLVADATKARRVCKLSESQTSMALVIHAVGALAISLTDKTRTTTTVLSWRVSRLYLITLSALASTLGGMVRPICFAAFRLITSSNLVGCSMGRSPGLAPLRILSTYVAARRNKSVVLGP